jgi:predicted nucleotidyltransferase
MYQNITQLKVLSLFMDNPYGKYYLREAARILKISPMTLKRSLDLLLKNKLILKEKIKNQILYTANLDNPAFRHFKIARNLSRFLKKDVVGFILKSIPGTSAIVLYGSYAKGEDDQASDIDLLVIAPVKKNISGDLSALIGKEVNLSLFNPAQWSKHAASNRAFYLDIITEGIILYGTRPVVG